MYKEDTDEWMGDIELSKYSLLKVIHQDQSRFIESLTVAANKLIAQANSEWFMFNVTDQKRADIY